MAANQHTFIDIFNTSFPVGEETVELKKIVIPIIQRDYAQGRVDNESSRVRERFLESLYKAITEKPITLDFVYGDINEQGIMTPLDGQQRLTTLFLLHWYAAKHEKIERDKYAFLHLFSYETRYSARDFCGFLVEYIPSFEKTLSKEIIDQAWFPLDWKKDSTISAMLVMLDEIHRIFADIGNLWGKLENGAISFYFLPIRDMGLSDELYIKMNSRGKPLSLFEHFKAEMEHTLKSIGEESSKRILNKIDTDWTDMLWKYRGNDNVIDDEFLCYFRFICDIMCYKSGGTLQGKRVTEFELLDAFFSSKNENAAKNLSYMEKCFDIWCRSHLNATPSEFLGRFISSRHENGKIMLDSKKDIFSDCLKNYADVYGSRNRAFPLNRVVLLYAIVVYLLNKDAVTEEDFARRLRIVHNLCRNSEDEISDSEQRTSGNRMPSILRQVDSIIICGIIDDKIENNFNLYQLSEESTKLEWGEKNPNSVEELFAVEDHELLYGQIGILGLGHPEYFNAFQELFKCNKDLIDCAMLSVGDYTQTDRNGWRHQIGSKYISKAWVNLFHKGAALGYDKTQDVLLKLLEKLDFCTDDALRKVINDYLSECENNSIFDWRYYYIKYAVAFRMGRYGKIHWADKENAPYEMLMIYAELYLSGNSYQPFLKLIDEDALSRDEYGQYLIKGDTWFECVNDGYYAHSMEDNEIIEKLPIHQNENGIDIENRVLKGMEWYAKF